MFKNTNIESLGTEYTVTDQNGKVIKSVQIIPHAEILDAALGPYDPATFASIAVYLEKSKEVLNGFEDLDPLTVLWFATSDEEVALSKIIEYAVKNGYDKIILEHIEDIDD